MITLYCFSRSESLGGGVNLEFRSAVPHRRRDDPSELAPDVSVEMKVRLGPNVDASRYTVGLGYAFELPE